MAASEPNEAVLADMVRADVGREPDRDVLTFEHLSLDGRATDEVRPTPTWPRTPTIAAVLRARGLHRGDRFAIMAGTIPSSWRR